MRPDWVGVNLIKSWLTTDPEVPPGSGSPEPLGDDYDFGQCSCRRHDEARSMFPRSANCRLSSMVLGW